MHLFTDGSETAKEWDDGVYSHIENVIGYTFNNKALLRQAFTRRSYALENGYDTDSHYELLEFMGDKVLDYLVVKALSEKLGAVTHKGGIFYSVYTEGVFTEFKKRLVEGKMLAWRIELLGLNKYLIMGKGERQNGVQNSLSAKEDLFEAILGAVAIDSNWNIGELDYVLSNLHDVGFYCTRGFAENENAVAVVQKWALEKFSELPDYTFSTGDSAGSIVCVLTFKKWKRSFNGYGNSQNEARLDASCKAREFLENNELFPNLEEAVGKPDWDSSVNQLQELWQKGYIAKPVYEFEQNYVENGNSEWLCLCKVDGFEVDWACSGKKVGAKKEAAYNVLLKIFDWYGVEWDEYVPDPFDFDNDDI